MTEFARRGEASGLRERLLRGLANSLPQRRPLAEAAMLLRQLALLLESGIGLSEALGGLRLHASDPRLSLAFALAQMRVQCGQPLSQALEAAPLLFSAPLLAVIRAGEASGTLPQNLLRCAESLEQELDLRLRLSGAAFYPLLVFCLTTAIGLAMSLFVLPLIRIFFADFSGGEAQLPAFTRLVINSADWLRGHWYLLLSFPFLPGLWRQLRGCRPVRRRLDGPALRLPLIGRLNSLLENTRFARSLSLLLSAGLPMAEALALASDTVLNLALRRELEALRAAFARGEDLAARMQESRYLAPLMPALLAAAPDEASSARNLALVSDYFDREFSRTLKLLHRLTEPALLVLIGLWAGAIVVAMYLPLFNLVDITN